MVTWPKMGGSGANSGGSVGGGCISMVSLRFQRTRIETEMMFVTQVKEAGGNKELQKFSLGCEVFVEGIVCRAKGHTGMLPCRN